MGNELGIESCCCSKREELKAEAGGSMVILENEETPDLEEFIANYKLDRLLSNCNGGIIENYICHKKGFLSHDEKQYLVSSIGMRSDGNDSTTLHIADRKLRKVMDYFDPVSR